jgi:hypothetical protein
VAAGPHGAFHGISRGTTALLRSRPVRAAVLASRYLGDPSGTLSSTDRAERALLREAGGGALALGVAISFAIPPAIGTPLLQRFIAAGWVATWALARLFVMRLTARGALGRDLTRVNDAWGPALLPFALAVVDPLPLIALGVSAFLTLRGLAGMGVDRREARRVVAIAFGGQLAAEVVAWLARGGLVYLLLARG